MRSETTMVAEQCRLREWAAQIRDCQSRPSGMSVVEWCACHGITKANYYYRLRRVRMSDGELRETQTANYFSKLYPIDCAVPSVDA